MVETMMCICDAVVDGLCEPDPIVFTIKGYAGVTPISAARNLALAEFLASECDDLVYIDADLAWEKGALIRLVKHPVDLVCGVYPYRCDDQAFPVRWADKPELRLDQENKLLEIAGTGFGFTKVSRRCAQKMVDNHEHLSFPSPGSPKGKAWLLFQLDVIEEGCLFSEDMMFCRRWMKLGERVWCDPEILFMHIGNKGFLGCLGDWLRNRKKVMDAQDAHCVEACYQ